MNRIGIIRLHRWITTGTFVFDKLGKYVDGLFFYYNNLCCPELLHIAQSHPKCEGVRKDDTDWSKACHQHAGHLSYQRCMKWADEIKPETVFIFDEDQAPSNNFLYDLEKWKESGKTALQMKWHWCWGDTDTVIDEDVCGQAWFTMGYRWQDGLSDKLPGSGNSVCGSNYHCEYKGLNLGVMTEDIRSWRTEKKRGWWLNEPFKITPYYGQA